MSARSSTCQRASGGSSRPGMETCDIQMDESRTPIRPPGTVLMASKPCQAVHRREGGADGHVRVGGVAWPRGRPCTGARRPRPGTPAAHGRGARGRWPPRSARCAPAARHSSCMGALYRPLGAMSRIPLGCAILHGNGDLGRQRRRQALGGRRVPRALRALQGARPGGARADRRRDDHAPGREGRGGPRRGRRGRPGAVRGRPGAPSTSSTRGSPSASWAAARCSVTRP